MEIIRTSKVMKRIRDRVRSDVCLARDDGVDCQSKADGNLGLCKKHHKRHERALAKLSKKAARIYLQAALTQGIVLKAQEIRDFKPGDSFSALALESRDTAQFASEAS